MWKNVIWTTLFFLLLKCIQCMVGDHFPQVWKCSTKKIKPYAFQSNSWLGNLVFWGELFLWFISKLFCTVLTAWFHSSYLRSFSKTSCRKLIESLYGKMLVENKHTVLQQQITQTFLNQWEWVKPPSLAYMEHFTTVPK